MTAPSAGATSATRQTRVGRDGRPFSIFKFRTLSVAQPRGALGKTATSPADRRGFAAAPTPPVLVTASPAIQAVK